MTVVKPDLLINCKDLGDLMKLDLDKKNTFMKLKGFQPYLQLPSSKKHQINSAHSDFNDYIQFVSTIAKKLFDKSPMCYNVVRNSAIFDPLIMSQENREVLQSRL